MIVTCHACIQLVDPSADVWFCSYSALVMVTGEVCIGVEREEQIEREPQSLSILSCAVQSDPLAHSRYSREGCREQTQ
jgi:hypothetical protein